MRKALISFIVTLCVSICYGQKTINYTHPDKLFFEGKEFFDMQQYGAAYHIFNKYLETKEENRSPYYGETEYYIACCAYEMGERNAEKKLSTYLSHNPNSILANRAHLLKGTILYNEKDFINAIQEFENCDITRLNKDEQNDLLFRRGYSYLENGSYDKAKENFTKLLQDSTKYNQSSQYYNAYVDYVRKDYEAAYPVFLSLQNQKGYEKVIPYYLFQIYYAKRDYDAVLSSGEELLKNDPENVNNQEVHRILGECYYEKKDYKNTIKYLSLYQSESNQVIRSNMYMLGISYYQMGDFVNAINCFQSVTSIEDAMSQNAYLYLGACYVKDENYNNARLCFESAGRMDYEQNVKEEAQYNYALIVYQQSYSPFNESITAFETFLSNFQDSRYKDRVYNYMVNLYLTTKNYSEALKSIQKIENKTLPIYEARQRITYSLGVQNYNIGEYEEAIKAFDESLQDGKYNSQLAASSIFWRGEAYYKMKEYDKASADFAQFVNSVGARSCDEFNLAHYNMGYTYFTQKDYSNALTWFRKYVNMEEKNKTLIADATNRIGDCYFNFRDFDNAQKNYATVYALRGPGADYACFQEGFIQGLQKNYNGKISTLNKLIKTFPQSEYIADAEYEIGRSYVMLGESQKAIATYDKLNKEYPHSPLSRKGRLQTGMLYDELNDFGKASSTYKEIINNFPSSAEAKTALESLKNLYFEKDDIQGFADYVESLNGLAKFDKSEQDSLTYLAAERLFEKGEYERAIASFGNYINKYPNSCFVYDAHFNTANSYYKLGNKEKAEPEYQIIANQIGSSKREEALTKLSEIQFDAQNYTTAIATMSTLDSIAQNAENKQAAKIGILRCNNLLGKTDETIIAASNIIKGDYILDANIRREALFTRAKAYEISGDSAKAYNDYLELSNNCMDEYGAESKYRIAEYNFSRNDLTNAEKEIFDFIDKNTPHQYWLAKSFILLSDIYVKQNRDFEAKQYLMSVRENYKGKDDISTEIKIRLEQIEAREAEKIVNENK
ncbi:MAG: tetratricopeptide repeat protein [Paludibacteraceae bacterium]|nr:tetratricopeptide repeat protein [Paludibacteraceae bacterium]